MSDRPRKKVGVIIAWEHTAPRQSQIVVYCTRCDSRFAISHSYRHWDMHIEQLGGLQQTCHCCGRDMNSEAIIPSVLIPEHMIASCSTNLADMLDKEFKL